jgi:hypothetical protein
MSNLPIIKNEAALANLAAFAAQTQEMRLLKFNKGFWLVGDNEVPAGREYIAHVDQLTHGWTKFADGKVVEQRVGNVAQGFKPASREELGDNDQSKWAKDHAGQPRDPWTMQIYLPLEDTETYELVSYVTNSKGGISVIGKLANAFRMNVHRGLPIVRLEKGRYKNKTYNTFVDTPELVIAGWTGAPAPARDYGPEVLEVRDYDTSDVPF